MYESPAIDGRTFHGTAGENACAGRTAEKLSPYECGFAAFEGAHMQFDVRYYLIAILFIVFDLEIAFVFPWALVFRELGVFGLVEMGVFLALLVIGFAYVWKKGALDW